MIAGIAIGGFIGTIVGYALCAMMVISKKDDKDARDLMKCPYVYNPITCPDDCSWVDKCNCKGDTICPLS